jgi:threonine dehydrogenase-like Zn-dependent dehydrogenase
MKIAVLNEPGHFDVVEEPEPTVGPGDALLQVAACGVCTSELDIFQGNSATALPWYPGHEVSGVVAETGQLVRGLAAGDRVAGWVTARGFAERVVLPAAHCFPAREVPLELALGEPLACAVNAVDLAAPEAGDNVVIVGAGFMGHLFQKLVMLRQPRQVIVIDTRDDALARAELFGATATVNVTRRPAADVVADLTGAKGADMTFEVTGAQSALDGLHEVTRMSGTLVIAGYHQGEPRRIPLGTWNWMAYRIVNAHFREQATILRGMRRGMQLLTSGLMSLDGLVTHAVPLERIDEGFRVAMEKPAGFVKATVQPQTGQAQIEQTQNGQAQN